MFVLNFCLFGFVYSPWDWSKIGIKLGTKNFIHQKLNKFCVEKGYLC